MERKSTEKAQDSGQAPEEEEKARWRFRTIDYMAEFAPLWSSAFTDRTRLLWEMIQGDKTTKNESNWAQCCSVYERRKLKGRLGHQKEALIPIGRLLAQERIHTETQLMNYLIRTLPKNADSELLLPQINMRHQLIKKEEPELSTEDLEDKRTSPLQLKAEETESRLIDLETTVQELTKENKTLKSDISVGLCDLGAQITDSEA